MRAFRFSLFLLFASAAALAEGPKPTPTPRAPETPLTPPPASTQEPTRKGGSLADTVRRAKASATPVPKKKSLGTITNETLKKGDGGKGSLQVGSRPAADLPPTGASTPAQNDETRWRDRASSARQRVAQAEDEVRRLDLEVKRLENDFYAWSDGNYRDRVIKPAWDQARDDLKKARTEYDDALAAQNDLEEEARKAGVPPGWLREASPR